MPGMAAPRITIKRGDSFRRQLAVEDAAGVAISIAGWQIASQVRTLTGELVAVLSVVDRDDLAGTFSLDASTATWPVGMLVWDVQYTDATGRIVSTQDVMIKVLQDRTL